MSVQELRDHGYEVVVGPVSGPNEGQLVGKFRGLLQDLAQMGYSAAECLLEEHSEDQTSLPNTTSEADRSQNTK